MNPGGDTTNRFSDGLVRWVMAVPAAMLVAALWGSASGRTVWKESVILGPEQDYSSPLIELDPPALGAYRIEAQADIATMRWGALQFGVENENGETLVEAGREIWDEEGTWYEEGQSGTWHESDTDFMLEADLATQDKVRLTVELLEMVEAKTSVPVNETATVHMRLEAGVMDARWLWFGFFATLIIALLARFSAARGGHVVIAESVEDSELKGRALMGGKKHLVYLHAAAVSDETTPVSMRMRVVIRDENGRTFLDHAYAPDRRNVMDEGELDAVHLTLKLYVHMPRRTSYGLWVEVQPDRPVDRLRVIVRDGHRPVRPVPVVFFPDDDDDTAGAPQAEGARGGLASSKNLGEEAPR